MSSVWLNDLSSANLLRKTYISGFLDISGGDMNLRSGNFFTGGLITQNTDSNNITSSSYGTFSITDLSYMFASITQPMTTFAQDITTNGNTIVKNNLFVTNDTSLNRRLFLESDASLNSKLYVAGDVSMNSRLFLGGDASLNSKLFLRGDASLNSKLSVAGDASLNSKLFLRGDASLNSKLSVAGDASLNSKLSVASDVSMNSKLSVADDALLNSKLVLAGDLSMNGNLKLRNNCVFYGNNILIKSPTPNSSDNCFLNITSSTDTGGSAQNIILGVSGAIYYRQAIINTYKDGVSDIVPLSLQVNSVEKIRIESTKTILTGNVGIQTSNPTVVLDVSGGAQVSGNVAIGKTSAGVALDVSGDAKVSGYVSIGTNINTHKLNLRSDTLSSVQGSTSNTISLVGSLINNSSYLNIYNYRYTTGSTWLEASTRIQNVMDITNQSYIEFNPQGSNGGIGFYAANTLGLTDTSGGITINRNGNVAIGKITPNSTLDISGTALISGNVAIGKTTANSALDVSGRFIVNGSISYSNYYFKFTCTDNMAITNGTSINFTNNTGTPYYNSSYTQNRYFSAPVTGYYHLSYVYNLASTGGNNKIYVGFYTSGSDPTSLTFSTATWTNANFLAIHANETNSATNLFIGTITTNVYLTSGQRVYVVVTWQTTASITFTTYSWGHPATNIWTGYLISQ